MDKDQTSEQLIDPCDTQDPGSQALRELLVTLGIKPDYSTMMQAEIFLEALGVFHDRNTRYGDGWKGQGWKGNVSDLLRKAKRVRAMFWAGEHDPADDPDDVIDMMNYGAFVLRNARTENKWGS